MNNIEALLSELSRSSMNPESSSYNSIKENQSSMSYRLKIEQLYNNAVSELYGLNDTQRKIVIRRIGEVQENQKYFDIPTNETVNSLLRDYNNQTEGKRNKTLLNDYRYCKFVLECVAIQRDYLEKVASLVKAEAIQENVAGITDISKADEDKVWLSVEETASKFKLPLNNIKSRQWRIEHDFPYKGFDEMKGAYNKVVFNSNDVEDWIKNHKKK